MKPNRILFCATVDYHFERFHLPVMRWFKERGWEVHVAASGKLDLPYVDRKFDLPIRRTPLAAGNLTAYRMLRAIIEENDYRFIHSHTPMGGVLARLAARGARSTGTHVLYTAHGFHFCKGASPLSWMLYYPIERMLACVTDTLITINEEDYRLAAGRRFAAGRILRVHGVGVDLERFAPADKSDRTALRAQIGCSADELLMFYAAEFNKNKNQRQLIRAMAIVAAEFPQAKLLLAGEGPLRAECEALAERLGVRERVEFLGHRSDIDRLLPACDIGVASSYREGLPVNVMEAMACGLPIVATSNRGHRELILDGRNGWIVPPDDAEQTAARMKQLLASDPLRRKYGEASRAIVVRNYGLDSIMTEMRAVYASILGEMEVRQQWASR